MSMFESYLDGSTIKILDKYMHSKKQYFLIKDELNIKYNNHIYSINFIISNKIRLEKTIVQTNITMTEFKKIYNTYINDYERLLNFQNTLSSLDRTSVPKLSVPVFDFLNIFYSHFKRHINSTAKIIFFDNPISINAQSSVNRTGYGNTYCYNTLIYEGTKYGETNSFPLVGYQISKIWEIRDNCMIYTSDDGSCCARGLPDYLIQ